MLKLEENTQKIKNAKILDIISIISNGYSINDHLKKCLVNVIIKIMLIKMYS